MQKASRRHYYINDKDQIDARSPAEYKMYYHNAGTERLQYTATATELKKTYTLHMPFRNRFLKIIFIWKKMRLI